MEKITAGVFSDKKSAESFIKHIRDEMGVSDDQISYVYKNDEGEVKEVDVEDIDDQDDVVSDAAEGAKKGAGVGAAIGALGGLAVAVGVIPVIGPLFAAGPLVAALGLTGGVGATAAGAATGAAAGAAVGGLASALANLGINKERATEYEESVAEGNVLVVVDTDNDNNMAVEEAMLDHGATLTETYASVA